MAFPVHAAERLETELGIRAVIVQCGTQEDARRICAKEDRRCCLAIDPSYIPEEEPETSQTEDDPLYEFSSMQDP